MGIKCRSIIISAIKKRFENLRITFSKKFIGKEFRCTNSKAKKPTRWVLESSGHLPKVKGINR